MTFQDAAVKNFPGLLFPQKATMSISNIPLINQGPLQSLAQSKREREERGGGGCLHHLRFPFSSLYHIQEVN